MRMDGMLFAATLLASSATAVAQTTLPPASADWFVLGTQPTGTFGRIASAGDVDGDGYDDVAIGDSGYDGAFINTGRITIHRGSATSLAAAPSWTVEGSAAQANLSAVVRAGDVNGDGFDDLLIGKGDISWQGGMLYLGSAAGPVPSSWPVGPNQYPAGAGDLNGDGFADLMVLLDGNVVHIFHGSAAGLPSVPSTVFVVASDFSSRISGIAIDDLTGDGFDDVALLWEDFLADGSVHRELNVHHGSTDGLVLKRRNYLRGSQFRYPASSGVTLAAAGDVDADGLGDLVIVSGEFPFNLFWLPGRSSGLSSQPDFFGLADANVKGLGDFNGDGFADLVAPIIGGNFWRLDTYAGGPEGYLTTPVLAVGPIGSGGLPPVSAAGDVNGDGFADLIGTEPGYDAAGGRVFVFLGRPTP